MPVHYSQLARRVNSQSTGLPDVYGQIDFRQTPYRFTVDPQVKSGLPEWVADRAPFLADERLVELMRTATMLGDVVADSYASLLPRYGVGGLVTMLRQACRAGIDSVADAPPQLRAFIADMEVKPDWLDMRLVELGARHSRISAAYLSPFLTRGAFIATFLNTYSALPMVITGALSGRRAAHRINETTSFFAVTTLPGALDRYGLGFEAAAMVRLMHSVVRYNALVRSDQWDVSVYGIPVPQVDQMPAGLINMYILATGARRRGRTEFSEREREILEFSRYRCFLLGLPEELLPTTPQGVIDVFHARAACLRDDFDQTCRELVRSTMAAYLRPDHTRFDRIADAVEKSWSKAFVLAFCGGDRQTAADMGVRIEPADLLRAAATAPFILGRFFAVIRASKIPAIADRVDARTIRMVKRRLTTYGRPSFTTDPDAYPAT